MLTSLSCWSTHCGFEAWGILILMTFYDVTAVPCTIVSSVDGTRAECSGRRLTRFPKNLPSDVERLDISSNFLRSLGDLAGLSGLRVLDVSSNLLTSLPDDAFRFVPYLVSLNLSHNGLRTMSSGVFRGLHDLTSLSLRNTSLEEIRPPVLAHVKGLLGIDLAQNKFTSVPSSALNRTSRLGTLDLSGNHLEVISDESFVFLPHLQHLYLQQNSIHSLYPEAFSGLKELRALDLSDNHLKLNHGSYPPGVFSPLAALESLVLCNNDMGPDGEYPINVFTPLPSLQTLSIDTFQEPRFDQAFSLLRNLTSLRLYGPGCNMKRLSNDTFDVFRGEGFKLETLYIYGCALLVVDTCTFCELSHLSSLTVNFNNIQVSFLLLALYGLQNQTMQLVDFAYNKRFTLPTVLDKTNTIYLYKTCIVELNLVKTDIAGMASAALRFGAPLLKCLKHVDFSQNILSCSDISLFFKLIFGLTSIETFLAQDQRVFSRLERNSRVTDASDQPDYTLEIPFAGSSRVLNLGAAVQEFGQLPRGINFPWGGNLTSLSLAYGRIYDCNTTVTGLTTITDLDLSGNDCSVLDSGVFSHMGTLRRLVLSDLNLQTDVLMAKGSELLRPLEALQELDLGHNRLLDLPEDLLRHQTSVRSLRLAGNRLLDVSVDISHQPSLAELDLSANILPFLSAPLRETLDRLAATHVVSLRLRDNPLLCTCAGLDTVRWLATTLVRLDGDCHNQGYDEDYDDNGRDYPCVTEEGGKSSTGSAMALWDYHWRRCLGLQLLTVSAVALLVQLLALVTVYLLWSRWPFVCHAWHLLRHLRLPRRHDFERDALFVYADDDLELAMAVKRSVEVVGGPGLRLALLDDVIRPGDLLAEKIALNIENSWKKIVNIALNIEKSWTVLEDVIQPGEPVAEKIGLSIENSWKIVLLVTQTFLEDDMSGFSVLQAQRSVSDALPDRVLMLQVGALRPGDHGRLSFLSLHVLLRMLPVTCVYQAPRNVTAMNPVWGALAQHIAMDRQ